MTNFKIKFISFLTYFIFLCNLNASDALATKAITGAAFAIQLVILGGIFYLVKFLYKKIFNK